MGYRGKVVEQERARELRAEGQTLVEIATELRVSKSSVSLWVRDVVFTPQPRHRPTFVTPHPQHLAKLAEIEAMNQQGRDWIGALDDASYLAAGAALYAGEGSKRDGEVRFANTDPTIVRLFCAWLRHFFEIEERRLKMRVYLHAGLDLDLAMAHWTEVTGIPRERFRAPHRPVAREGIRRTKHEFGCAYVSYSCTRSTGRSWVSSVPCYRQKSFRGSSIGGAAHC